MMSDAFEVSLTEGRQTCGAGLEWLGRRAVEFGPEDVATTDAHPSGFFGMLDISSILLPRRGLAKPGRRTCSDRAKLERAFVSIDKAIPRLLGSYAMTPCFWAKLGDIVARSVGRTNSDDHDWIIERLMAVLAIHGITER